MREYTKAIKRKAYKLIEFYRQHPVVAAKDLLGVELADIQALILNDMWFKNYVIVVAGRGVGKALDPDTPVATPDRRWVKIKDLKPGDKVFGGDGKICNVIHTSGILKDLDFYRIYFNDGRIIDCCADHLWLSKCGTEVVKPRIISTEELYKVYIKSGRVTFCLPQLERPVKYDLNYRLKFHAYLLGVILARGFVRNDQICINTTSPQEAEYIRTILPPSTSIIKVAHNIYAFVRLSRYDVLRTSLKRLGLYPLNPSTTFVPEKYKYTRPERRAAFIDAVFGGKTRFVTPSIRLAKDVTEVARSLGKHVVMSKQGRDYIVSLRKAKTVGIKRIIKLEPQDGCCIMVDSKDHTYVTKDYIVTHNSFLQAVHAVLICLLYPGKSVGLVGAAFRQAKVMFKEVDRLYQTSPILQQACERRPIHGSDMCLLKFKPAGRFSGTRIAAIPLGTDGGKIRGERFHIIAADEFAQIPEDIFSLVIKPMAATSSDPMERVKKIQRKKELRALGIEVDDDDDVANKIIMTSSGYFKFNHMWDRMKYYWYRIKKGDKRYAVHQVPYWFMPEGFLDETNIEEARATLATALFEMEYCGLMVDDTDGFFKASLIEEATAEDLNDYHTVKLEGEPDREYVMAVDPARERDSFAIVIFEMIGKKAYVVYAKEFTGVSSVVTTKHIFKLRDNFNLTRIIMDSQGGGSNIRDLLEEGIDNNRPILNIDEPRNLGRDGDMILELFNPSPKSNTAANYTALSMLEHKRVMFPAPPLDTDSDELADVYDSVQIMKQQIIGVVATPISGGYMSFNSSSASSKKDLYSCFIMGCHAINNLYKEASLPDIHEEVLDFAGVVQPRDGGFDDGYDAYLRDRDLIVPEVY